MFPKTLTFRIVWLLWFMIALAVLVLSALQIQTRDVDVVFYFLMMGLTFPIGFLVLLCISFIPLAWLNGIFSNDIELTIFWFLLVVFGHLQWFVAIPKIFNLIAKWLKSD
jgi:hypothetical protein